MKEQNLFIPFNLLLYHRTPQTQSNLVSYNYFDLSSMHEENMPATWIKNAANVRY